MTKTGLQNFTLHLQQVLAEPWEDTAPGSYLRLDQVDQVTLNALVQDQGKPPTDPLIDAFNLIMEQAQSLFAENIVFGINEVFKTYLKKINPENQDNLTDRVLECMKMIFLFITEERFPYTEKIWEAMSAMIKPVGAFLIKERFTTSSIDFFQFAAFLGKHAARKGLSTGSLQHAFRIWELDARSCSCQDLQSLARNLRQNLEN